MIERIESFRRRRPRLLDDDRDPGARGGRQGVGGAGRRGVPRGLPQPAARVSSATARCSRCPSRRAAGDSAPIRSWCSRRRFPGGSIGRARRARHRATTSRWPAPCRPGSRRRSCSKRVSRSPSCRRSSPTWPPRPPRPACRSSPATPRWCPRAPPTGCSSPPPGVGVVPAGRELSPRVGARRRQGAAVGHRWAITAWR